MTRARPQKSPYILMVLFAALAYPATVRSSPLLSVVEHLADLPALEPEDVALAPDDRHVYLVGDAALVVLERDPATGSTRHVESHFDGRRGVAGLRRASALAISGDGRFLYTASPFHQRPDGGVGAAVTVFERRPSGRLRFAGATVDGFEAPGERFSAVHVVISPDDAHLYAASGPDESVLAYERDPASGALSFLGAVSGGLADTFTTSAVFDPQGRHLYVTSLDRGSVTLFERDPETGHLAFVEELMSDDPRHERLFPVFPDAVVVSPDGLFVYVANIAAFPFDGGDGTVVSFRRDPSTGRLTSPREVAFQARPTDLTMSADGARLFVPGAGSQGFVPLSGVAAYARDATTGDLELVEYLEEDPEFRERPGSAQAAALADDGRHLYVGGFNGRTLAPLVRRGESLDPVSDPADPTGGLGRLRNAARAAVTPDGRHVYVANVGNDSVSLFVRREDGGLDFAEIYRAPFPANTTTVAVAPDGRWVYALDGVFARDPAGGRLEPVTQRETFVPFAALDMAPSPDGRHLYTASGFGIRPVRVFAQSRATGRLVEREYQVDPVPGLGRLGASSAVAVSPDGAFVYAAGYFARAPGSGDDVDALWIFARDAESGTLRLEHFATLDLSNSSSPPPRLALSPEGRNLYLVHPGRGDLQVFVHDRRRGVFARIERHGNDEGFLDPRDVAVSPSGHLVYVAGRFSDGVAVFARDLATGGLTFLESVQEGRDGIEGLFRVEGLAASPDNRHLYASSPRLSGITALTLDCVAGADVFCTEGGRFRVDVAWRDPAEKVGTGRLAPPRTAAAGLFWFFSDNNWEMLVKVLDGCPVNGHVWVFAASTTTVETTLRVTDTRTGEVRRYFKPQGAVAAATTDTAAFASCP